MASFADIKIRFSADLKKFSSDMQNVRRSLDRTGKDLQKVGANLTLGLSLPLLGIGGLAVDAAADLETLKTSLNTVFQGNEEAANRAFAQITEFTSKTPFQLEQVADGFIKLKNLGLDPSIDSLRSYGNTASALGKDLNQFIEAVADAAVNEFERLKEFGIKSKQQGDQVAFTFQGITTTVGKNAEEIQEYLRQIGDTTFAGGIERQANTFRGIISTLKDNFKLLLAEFGQPLLEILKPIAQAISEMAARFRELSPETKKLVVILAGVAAAVGPLLALAGTILPAIGTGLALLTGPIGAVVAGVIAVGVAVFKYWEPIKQTLVDVANYFIDLYNESLVFRAGVEAIRSGFESLYNVGEFVFSALGDLFKLLAKQFRQGIIEIGDLFEAALTGNFSEIPNILNRGLIDSVQNVREFAGEISKDFRALQADISSNISDGVDRALRGKKYEYITTNVAEAVKEGFNQGTPPGGPNGGVDPTPFVSRVSATPAAGIADTGSLEIKADDIISTKTVADLDERGLRMLEGLIEFREGAAEIIAGAAEDLAVGFGQLLAGFANGTTGLKDVGSLLLRTLANIAINFGRLAIKIGIAAKALQESIKFPGLTIAAGIALVALGTLIKSAANSFAGNFASGGIVGGNSFAGDRLIAGVNSGELILNIAQQKNIARALTAQKTVVLQPSLSYDARGFKIMLDQVNYRDNRTT